jgi:propanediol dehydratase small subunit
MVLTIDIPAKTEEVLREQAQAAGKDVGQYASELLQRATLAAATDAALAPVWEEFRASGVTDEEMIRDITQAQSDYRAEQCRKQP